MDRNTIDRETRIEGQERKKDRNERRMDSETR